MHKALQLKKCSMCGISKSHEEFGRDARLKCGLRANCKQCASIADRGYRSNRKDPCKIDGCKGYAFGHGYCGKHYQRLRRSGDPLGGRTMVGDPLKFIHEVAVPFTGDECLTWPYARTLAGYGALKLNGQLTVSRFVCELAHGAPSSEDLVAAHSCGKGHEGCVNPKHLRWATQKENMADKIIHGTAHNGYTKARAALGGKPS